MAKFCVVFRNRDLKISPRFASAMFCYLRVTRRDSVPGGRSFLEVWSVCRWWGFKVGWLWGSVFDLGSSRSVFAVCEVVWGISSLFLWKSLNRSPVSRMCWRFLLSIPPFSVASLYDRGVCARAMTLASMRESYLPLDLWDSIMRESYQPLNLWHS